MYSGGFRPTEIVAFFENAFKFFPCLKNGDEENQKLTVPQKTYIRDLQGALPAILKAHLASFIQTNEYFTLCLDQGS